MRVEGNMKRKWNEARRNDREILSLREISITVVYSLDAGFLLALETIESRKTRRRRKLTRSTVSFLCNRKLNFFRFSFARRFIRSSTRLFNRRCSKLDFEYGKTKKKNVLFVGIGLRKEKGKEKEADKIPRGDECARLKKSGEKSIKTALLTVKRVSLSLSLLTPRSIPRQTRISKHFRSLKN